MKSFWGAIFFICAMFLSLMPVWAKEVSTKLVSGTSVEYLIVTPLRYAPIFQQLADWKSAKGVSAKVVTTEQIFKEYRDRGGDHASQIREFIKETFKAWNVKWVLLGGDTQDKDGEIIPARFARSGIDKTDIPSDLYYANFDGNWNGNRNAIFGEFKDNCDLTPEVYLARASVDSQEEASTFVQKVMNYEKNPPKNWVKRSLLVGANLDDFTSGQNDINVMAKEVFKNYQIRKVSEDKGATAESIRDEMSRYSPHFVFVTAHGAPEGFAANGFFNLEYADKLSNSFPFTYTSMSCNTNYFDKDCLSEHFLTNPKGGAVAYWACSRFGWYQKRNEGYYMSILMIKDFFSLLFNDPQGVSNHIGEAATRARIKYLPEAKKEDGTWRWLVLGMNLLGDPEMPVWTEEPQNLTVQAKADPKIQRISARVMSGNKPVVNAIGCLRYRDDTSLLLTTSGRNVIPAETVIAYSGGPGVYSVARSNADGEIILPVKCNRSVIAGKIEELARLDEALRGLDDYMKKIRSNRRIFEKLTRDYQALEALLDRNRKEVRAYFAQLAENKRFAEIEETLDFLASQVQVNPQAIDQFKFVLKAVTDKLRFDLAQMQQDSSGIQKRILEKILELQKGMSSGGASEASAECGRISVTSEPQGAQVYLDNVPKGQTPCNIEGVSYGAHGLKLRMQGYGAISESVAVDGPKTVRKVFALKTSSSIQGTVLLETQKPCTDAQISLVRYAQENGKSKVVVVASATPDVKGGFAFFDLGRQDMYLYVKKEGYNLFYKPLLFSQRDQKFKSRCEIVLTPLVVISGEDSSLDGCTVRLFEFEEPKYYQSAQTKVEKGAFSFKNVSAGTYRIFATKPGFCPGIVEFKTLDGKDKKITISCQPITTVHFFVRINDKWEKTAMTADKNGKYSAKVSLKAAKDPYHMLYFINLADKKEPSTIVLDPKAPTSTALGFLTNLASVSKDGEIEFTYDSAREPKCFVTEKLSNGKEVNVNAPVIDSGNPLK